MTALRIEVKEEFCEGIGYCARLCPEVFRVDAATSRSIVLQAVVTDAALIEKVRQAETTCPARAIWLSTVEPG